MVEDMGWATGSTWSAMIDAAADAERIIGKQLPSQVLRAGPRTRIMPGITGTGWARSAAQARDGCEFRSDLLHTNPHHRRCWPAAAQRRAAEAWPVRSQSVSEELEGRRANCRLARPAILTAEVRAGIEKGGAAQVSRGRCCPRESCSPGTGIALLTDEGSFTENGAFANVWPTGQRTGVITGTATVDKRPGRADGERLRAVKAGSWGGARPSEKIIRIIEKGVTHPASR